MTNRQKIIKNKVKGVQVNRQEVICIKRKTQLPYTFFYNYPHFVVFVLVCKKMPVL